ncbi:hypothetical protein BCIN_01g08160 [Botrytis cinerea B05.10]|uniref:Uncharacterized protein n=2 Tax=Botryotinia fuckeliana TaxID=40559 RepID=A0A384J694_BOTFB|nr:hypothetical protein BCIN_01g08160 [Botrytis cinerea B05.10]ATZ46168.1 hypothetical protein BCIN_01g08160 [Botrytis cinerea B05.10]CCD45895.1 hypothetical protein BofuT4_P049130.1 [Botrytis cinerea T4]
MPAAAKNSTLLQPKGLIDDKGDYALNQTDISNLLKYIWTGALLATTKEEYLLHTGINATEYDHLKEYVDPLLVVYTACKGHCVTFKDVTYRKVVDLSNAVYNFAGKAGGKSTGSYYANIISNTLIVFGELEKDYDEQDQALIKKSQGIVDALVKAQLKSITKLKDDANKVTQDLRDFETLAKADQLALASRNKIIKDKLTGEGGDIQRLQDDIKTKTKEISDDQDEYEQDVTIAATSVTYAWAVPVGPIIAAVIIGVYTDRAIKMKAKIDALRDLLTDDQDQLRADRQLVADLTLIQTDLQNVINQIGPAITTIQKMIGTWDAIADDLESINEAVHDDSPDVMPDVQDIIQESILSQWNDLKVSVDNYRKSAYISSAPEEMTLEEYSSLLQAAIDK